MDRILQGSRSKIQITFYDGETATDSSTLPTIEVVRDDGTEVVAAGTSTTDEAGTGIYSYVLNPGHTADLDRLTARWTATIGSSVTLTTTVEVVGAFYFSLAELRAMPNLSDTAKYTTAELTTARDWITDLIDREVGTSFVARYARDTQDGSGTDEMILSTPYPSAVASVKVDGVAFTSEELADLHIYSDGRLVRDSGSFATGKRNVDIRYEAGLAVCPEDLKRAALVAARHRLLRNENSQGTPAGARSVATDVGTFSLSFPGPNHPTGIDEVDEVIMAYKQRYDIPAVA